MRFYATAIANAVAWALLIALIGLVFVVVNVLGPFGLILLGLAVLFVCTSVGLHEDNPTWGPEVFKARQSTPPSPEHRAARADERERSSATLRFYRWCGLALLVAGITGFVWQQWHGAVMH